VLSTHYIRELTNLITASGSCPLSIRATTDICSMDTTTTNKRKRCDEPRSHDFKVSGKNASDGRDMTISADAEVASHSSAVQHESFEGKWEPLGVVSACRAALFESPRGCRAALSKYQTSIDPNLAKALKVLGDFKIKVISTKSSIYLFIKSPLVVRKDTVHFTLYLSLYTAFPSLPAPKGLSLRPTRKFHKEGRCADCTVAFDCWC